MSEHTRSLVRTAVGYIVIGIGLYLVFLTGPEGFSLSLPAYLFILAVIGLIFEQADSVASVIEAIAKLWHGGTDDDE